MADPDSMSRGMNGTLKHQENCSSGPSSATGDFDPGQLALDRWTFCRASEII